MDSETLPGTSRPPIAENIRALKERAGVTWRQVAEGTDATERQVLQWASTESRHVPSWRTCQRLAAYFSRQLDETIRPAYFYSEHEQAA
jgi:transcriptional regulator with XRE-family HTH domain